MRGIPDYNYPTFHHGAEKLRRLGHEVFSPAEKDDDLGGIHEDAPGVPSLDFMRRAMHADILYIAEQADAVYLLPGWEKSKGAIAEKAVAEAIGLKVVLPEDWYWDEPDVGGGDIPRPKRDPGDHMARELKLRHQEWDSKAKAYA